MKEFLISEFRKIESDAVKRMTSEYSMGTWVRVPVFLDGVLDAAIWDIKQNRFTELRIKMCSPKEGEEVTPHWSRSKTAVHCDGYKEEVIEL